MIRICKYCGKEFKPKESNRITYCSRECAFADRAKRCKTCGKVIKGSQSDYCSPECRLVVVICKQCGIEFKGRSNAKYCSDECRNKSHCNKVIERLKNRYNQNINIIKCKECGKLFSPEYGNKKRVFCSDECNRKNTRRTAKGIRRARKRGVGYENINPINIFKRDKWICQLCGVKTPRKFRGTTEDNAPELDHIIPLSLGGEHNAKNVQCLCRKCNHNKGATIQGQLLLFG